jgi:hypothetical protein
MVGTSGSGISFVVGCISVSVSGGGIVIVKQELPS